MNTFAHLVIRLAGLRQWEQLSQNTLTAISQNCTPSI